MKKKLNQEKLLNYLKKRTHFMVALAVIIFLCGMGLAAYFSIYPKENVATVKKCQEDLKKMEVTFDQKTVQEIKQERAPSILNGTGGRNPFTPL
ncbi:MAG: hypothetical protein WCI63_01255 [bacterium]